MELRGEATEAYADTAYRYAATHGSKSSVESTYAGAAAFIMEIMRYSKLQHNLYNMIYIIIYLHIVQLYLLKFTHFTNPPGQKWPYFGRVAVSAWIGRGRAWHLPTGWMLSPWKSKVFRRFISKHEDLLELCSFVVQLLQSPASSRVNHVYKVNQLWNVLKLMQPVIKLVVPIMKYGWMNLIDKYCMYIYTVMCWFIH